MVVVVLTNRTLLPSAMVQATAGYWTQAIIGQKHRHKCKLTPYIRLPAIESDWFHSLWMSIVAEITENSEWQGSKKYPRYNVVI